MVLDNARIHHAKLLQPFLKEKQNRLHLVYLPPYCPQLNIVEGLWKWLKSDVINNVFYYTTAEIRKNVQAFMDSLNKQRNEKIPFFLRWHSYETSGMDHI